MTTTQKEDKVNNTETPELRTTNRHTGIGNDVKLSVIKSKTATLLKIGFYAWKNYNSLYIEAEGTLAEGLLLTPTTEYEPGRYKVGKNTGEVRLPAHRFLGDTVETKQSTTVRAAKIYVGNKVELDPMKLRPRSPKKLSIRRQTGEQTESAKVDLNRFHSAIKYINSNKKAIGAKLFLTRSGEVRANVTQTVVLK